MLELAYQGHVEKGAIVLDEPIQLPEGAVVTIELVLACHGDDDALIPTLAERLAGVIGKAEDLPADWAENHDRYLREESGRL